MRRIDQANENNHCYKRPRNCYQISASDVPAASEEGTAKNSRPPARATAYEAALEKGYPAREACSRTGGNPPSTILGRPVARVRSQNAALPRAAFGASRPHSLCPGSLVPLVPWFFYSLVLSFSGSFVLHPQGASSVNLPAVSLRCSIEVAYQAADAGHPVLGRASSPPSRKNAVQFIHGCTRHKLA